MADSPKLTILKRLTALLEATVVTPYDYGSLNSTLPATLAGKVFRGRTVIGNDTPGTFLSILEAPRQLPSIEGGMGEARKDQWLLLINGACPEDRVNPTDPVYGLLQDVEKQLERVVKVSRGTGVPKYSTDYMLGRNADGQTLITDFKFQAGIVSRPSQDNPSSRAYFYIPVQVGIAKVVSD